MLLLVFMGSGIVGGHPFPRGVMREGPVWAAGRGACRGLFCFRGADDGSDVAGRLAFVDHELGYVEVMSRG